MAYVNHLIRSVDSHVWHGIENAAAKYPIASRALALPTALWTLVRDILLTPATAVEELALSGKSVKEYLFAGDQQTRAQSQHAIIHHLFRAVLYGIFTPLAPIIGAVDAIVTLFQVTVSPLPTAKLNAARQDLSFFLDSHAEYLQEPDREFVKAAWRRFQNRIAEARTNAEIYESHFLDSRNHQENLIQEIAVKKVKYGESERAFETERNQIHQNQLLDAQTKKTRIENLKERWDNFRTRLIEANRGQAQNLVFIPA